MKDWIGNSNSIFKTLGASNHTDKERQSEDFYATDPIAIDRLLKAYNIPHNVWECACGAGHLAKRLIEHGRKVYGSDLMDRGYGYVNMDFLMENQYPNFNDGDDVCILTNPPYKYATEFIEHALQILPKGQPCIMLLKTTALEGKARYEKLYRNGYLEAVYQFTERLLCAKNGDFEEMKKGGGSAVAYAWFVFRLGCEQPPKLYWI